MARPVGQAERQKDRLRQKIITLCKPACWAGNAALGKMMGLGPRQVQRHIKTLVKEGFCYVQIKRFIHDKAWKTQRYIRLTAHKKVWAKPIYPWAYSRMPGLVPIQPERKSWLTKTYVEGMIEAERQDREHKRRMKQDSGYRHRITNITLKYLVADL